ncbi:MAG TPA: hypothetical protein DEV93_17230, partial [Chloroflexi bacterium]|nr:hypothetical protein [Chloroflexota bacterium]
MNRCRVRFGRLIGILCSRNYAYVRARTPTVLDAEDLTLRVFMRALDSLDRFRGHGRGFAPWSFRIVRNLGRLPWVATRGNG